MTAKQVFRRLCRIAVCKPHLLARLDVRPMQATTRVGLLYLTVLTCGAGLHKRCKSDAQLIRAVQWAFDINRRWPLADSVFERLAAAVFEELNR